MKQGRKTSDAYKLYGFIPRRECGKHSAVCKTCKRVLQNTAASRLLRHRNSCAAAISSGKRKPYTYVEDKNTDSPIVTEKQQLKNKSLIEEHQVESCDEHRENVYEIKNVRRSVKTEEEEASFVESNDETKFEDTINNAHEYVEPSHKLTTKKRDKNDDKVKAKIAYITEKTKYFQSELNNLNVEKAMMYLEVKKIRLEIKQLLTEN